MAADLITMQCPNCGGKLQFGKSTTTLRCEHCGMEHLVRQGAAGVFLESYAQCPVCNRNDKAEKVSSIIRSQVKETESVIYQTRISYRQVGNQSFPVEEKVPVPIKTVQASDLAKQLAFPQRPPEAPPPFSPTAGGGGGNGLAVVLFVIGGLVFFSACLCGILPLLSGSLDEQTLFMSLLLTCSGMFVALLPVVAGILVLVFLVPKTRERTAAASAAAEERMKRYREEAEKTNKHWEQAMKRYDRLYYCQRDDCVFMQGETSFAPVGKLKEYLLGGE